MMRFHPQKNNELLKKVLQAIPVIYIQIQIN